jgi:hypothetical protein
VEWFEMHRRCVALIQTSTPELRSFVLIKCRKYLCEKKEEKEMLRNDDLHFVWDNLHQ